MAKTLDMLVRRATINGAPTIDSRLVIDAERHGILIGKIGADYALLASWPEVVDWTMDPNGTIRIADATTTVEAQRDTRCGGCNGRHELRGVDARPFFASVTAQAAIAEQA